MNILWIREVRIWASLGVSPQHFSPGRSIFEADEDGWTALASAAYLGHTNLVKYLIQEYHCDIHQTVRYAQETPLAIAAGQGHTEIVQVLLEAGASPFVNTIRVQSSTVHNILNITQKQLLEGLPLPSELIGCITEYLCLPPHDSSQKQQEERGAIMQLVSNSGIGTMFMALPYSPLRSIRQTTGRIRDVPTKQQFQHEKKISAFIQSQLVYDTASFYDELRKAWGGSHV